MSFGASLLLAAALGCDTGSEAAGPRLHDPSEPQPADESEPLGCWTSKDCEVDEYCFTPEGECDREGVCTPVPLVCAPSNQTVCSCDGVRYRSECRAAQDKQSVDFLGPCPPPTCTSNAQCGADAYCAKAAGDCGGLGVCEARPLNCSGLWNPVCGCNKKTYANGCKAAAVGVGVLHLGTC